MKEPRELNSKTEGGKCEESAHETWANTVDFLFATLGFAIGLGNIWRFPYVCYRNGGGVFLIPYLVSVLCIGIPVVFLEGAYGQFMSKAVMAAWKICPIFQGIGVAQSVLCFYINLYYNVILAWVLYYLFSSFTTVLPWSTCGNPWNSDNCREHHWSVNSTNATYNWTSSQDASFTNVSDFRAMDPATEYWERKVLAISAGVEFSGSIKWDLALCLLLAWVVVYFCVWKGIKLSGKISYVTVISPYILLVVLLIRGATLPGAGKGIHFYLSPEWSKLGVVKVWVEAGIQVFFSYGVGLGIHTSLASCNSFHHNCLKHHLIFSLANTCTSLLGGFVIFSVLGFMADKYQLSVAHVAGSGPGLAFVAYPEAVAQMPIAPLWSCIFFLLLFFVGIDSQFLQVEAFMVILSDLLPQEFQRSPRKEICTAVACLIWFCLGLCMVTEGGIYVEQLFEWYAGGRVIMFIVVLECLAISYVYGVNRLQRNLEYMLGYRLFPYFKVCWAAITPLLGGFLFIMDIVLYPEQTYNRKFLIYHFPGWAMSIGWTLASIAVMFVPGVMVYRLLTAEGTLLERLRDQTKPHFSRVQRSRDKHSLGASLNEKDFRGETDRLAEG